MGGSGCCYFIDDTPRRKTTPHAGKRITQEIAAALAWTEALTELDPKTDLGPLRARPREHFWEKEIGVLTATVGMINLWNRIAISRH